MIIPDWLARRAATHPQHLALLATESRWSFAELDQRANTLAAHMISVGLCPGDRVAVLAGNTADYVALIHAAPRCGVVLVLLNIRLTPTELAFQVEDSAARLIVADASHYNLAAHIPAPELGLYTFDTLNTDPAAQKLSEKFAHPAPPPQPSPAGGGSPTPPPSGGRLGGRSKAFQTTSQSIDLAAPHTIIYTSGTTGNPKGTLLSCGNHWWSASASMLNLGLHADDCWLAVLPLFHVGGLAIILRSAIYGIPVVLHERFDPVAVNAAISAHQVTIISVVAATLQRMLDAQGETPYPSHLRCALLGGGPAPRPLLERCASLGLPVVQTYGMTESASQAVTLAPADALRKLGSAGQPLLPVSLRIIVGEREAAPGEVGEILLSGPTITSGYIGRPAINAELLANGWLHTGDLGYRDTEGYLYVVDRRSDLIISGGENIYPAEIEALLLAHPAIAEAGVVGLPDPRWGQTPVAAVVLRNPVSEAEILAFLRERLASYKLPRRIYPLAELPHTASGKLQRGRLRALIASSKLGMG